MKPKHKNGAANAVQAAAHWPARAPGRSEVLFGLAVVCLILSLGGWVMGRADWANIAPAFSLLGAGTGFAGWWLGRSGSGHASA